MTNELRPDGRTTAAERGKRRGAARQGGPDAKGKRTLSGLHALRSPEEVGAAPGIEVHELAQRPSARGGVPVTCVDYSAGRMEARAITDIEDFIIQHRPEWATVQWINIDGLTDMDLIKALAEKYDLHPLAIEDLLHVPQRPKVETYPARGEIQARVFIVARMLQLVEEGDEASAEDHKHLSGEQVSMFLGHHTVLTFQESAGSDVFDRVRERLRTAGSRVRQNDASFLAYSLIDAIVDQCFPILEYYSDRLEDLEEAVLSNPERAVIQQIHGLKRELLVLRRAVWPMREVVNSLAREQHECLSEMTKTYFRDVYDHSVQIIDMMETYREFASGLTETYMSALSNRMNEVMKVLTIITTIFVPLTFLAGVYGMNFTYLPEKDQWWGYPVFWAVCVATAVSMVMWFRRRGWV